MNMGKTKIMVGGLDLNLLKRSGKVPCSVCQKGVGSNAILSCGGCLHWIHKKCSDIKMLLHRRDEACQRKYAMKYWWMTE